MWYYLSINDIPIAKYFLYYKNGDPGLFVGTFKQGTNWKPTTTNPLVLAPQSNPSKGGRRNINRTRLMMSVRNWGSVCAHWQPRHYGIWFLFGFIMCQPKSRVKARIGGVRVVWNYTYYTQNKKANSGGNAIARYIFTLVSRVKRANLNGNT